MIDFLVVYFSIGFIGGLFHVLFSVAMDEYGDPKYVAISFLFWPVWVIILFIETIRLVVKVWKSH